MFPRLFEVLGEPVPAYFTLLMVGFAIATFVAQRAARRAGLDHDTIIDLGLFSVIAGVVGGRLLHVFADGYFWDYVHLCTDPSQVAWRITQGQCARADGLWDAAANVCRPREGDCFAWAKFWQGGLAYYGGLIAATGFGVWFLRRERFPVLKGTDMVALGLPLGLFFGRLGCFLGGCCFGSPTDHPLAVRFPPWSAASEAQWRAGDLAGPHLESLAVHPAQLYEAAGCLAIAVALVWLRPRKRFDGQIMIAFVALYAVLRFFLEFIRADDRGNVAGLSTSQWIGLVLLVGVAVVAKALQKTADRTKAAFLA